MNIEISPKEYERELNWYDGLLYLSLLEIDGKSDWRLPTFDELEHIYKSVNDFVRAYYWSSAEYTEDSAGCLGFIFGARIRNGKHILRYVRPVRTIEPS
jgi:hypothetical protein